MNLDNFINRLTNSINKYRPAEKEPVVFSPSDDSEEEIDPNRSPRWQKSTKRIVIISLVVLAVICLYFLRNMITPLIFSALMIFYLGPVIKAIEVKWKISHKWSVIIVFVLFLLAVIGLFAAGGVSLYGQAKNFIDLLSNSVESFPEAFLEFLGGPESMLGKFYLQNLRDPNTPEISDRLQNIMGALGGNALGMVQSFSSKIGWFFFVYGFSFFILWESKEGKKEFKLNLVPGYDHDIEMAGYHLSLIWKRFLWGEAMLMLITLVIYTILFLVLGVHYALILAGITALMQLVPYIGSFFAWGAVLLVCLAQGSTIFHMQPLPYALVVVLIAFLIDKFKDGFIQPKFLAETLRVHPAAILAAALVCARSMGFLGVFLAAPIVATLKLLFRYIFRKLRDEDPWEGIITVSEQVSLKEYLSPYREKCVKIYKRVLEFIRNLRTRLIGGKENGSNGY